MKWSEPLHCHDVRRSTPHARRPAFSTRKPQQFLNILKRRSVRRQLPQTFLNITKYNLTICSLLLLTFSTTLSAQPEPVAQTKSFIQTPPGSGFVPSHRDMVISAPIPFTDQLAIDLSPFCRRFSPPPNDTLSRNWQAEWAVGKELADEIERDETIIGDPSLTQYLNDLEQAIVNGSHLRGCFVVKLIHDVEPNAYALPGGFLYVTSGLILMAHSESELTGALAHETAHVTAKHFARIEHTRQIWGRVALAGGPAGYFIRRVMGPLFTRKLIRNTEFDADRLCLKYQSASGYDPIQFERLLQNTFQDESAPASFVKRLFDTHPSTTARIRRLDRLNHRLSYPATNYVVDTSTFHEFKQHLSRLVKVVGPDLTPTNER